MNSPIVPSARTLLLLALFAPVAVVIAATAPDAWVVAPVLALVLLAAVAIDGLLAGRLLDLKLHHPSDVEVGQPARISLHAEFAGRTGRGAPEAALGFDPRLGERGAAAFTLERGPVPDIQAGETEIVPTRRGTGDKSGQTRTGKPSARWTWRCASPSGPGQRSHRSCSSPVPRRVGTISVSPARTSGTGPRSSVKAAVPRSPRRGSKPSAACGAPPTLPANSAWSDRSAGWPTSTSLG